MAQNMTSSFMNTSDNQKYIKTIGSISKDQISILVMNQDQNMDFGFDIILNKNGKSKKPLVINADAFLDMRISGRIEKQSSMMFVFDAQGKLLKQISYGLKQNLKNQAPEVEEIK
jgi:hypothetical protein